jgi:hypothetical protein
MHVIAPHLYLTLHFSWRLLEQQSAIYCPSSSPSNMPACPHPDKDEYTTIELTLQPGSSLGVSIQNSNSSCVVVSKKNPHSPLQVGDVIVSLNGVNLREAQGGMNEWVKLFSTSASGTRNLVVERPANPPPDILEEQFNKAHSHITDEKLLKYLKNVTSVPIETILEKVRLGDSEAITAVNNLATPDELAYRSKLVEGGLIGIYLDLLKKCDGTTFAELFGEEGGEKFVPSPIEWMGFLSNYVTSLRRAPQSNPDDIPGRNGDPICIEIAENLGPLIKCMRDDQKRELFGSKLFWYQTYPFFIIFVTNLVMMNNKAMPILLQYENGEFLKVMVQHLFINKYRDDIMKDDLAIKWILPRLYMSADAATRFVYLRIAMIVDEDDSLPGGLFTDEQTSKLYKIGVTPVVNESFDPNCNVSFMRGIVELVGQPTDDPTSKNIFYYFLSNLSVAGCVDADVINGVIRLGMKASDKLDADKIPPTIFRLLHLRSSVGSCPVPDDTRYACAISSGLLEMVLKMVVLCGKTNSDDGMGYLKTVVGGATAVSTHPKSSNAITNILRASTKELLSMPDLTSLIESNTTANDIIGSIVFLTHPDLNPPVRCVSCSKVLISEVIKRCSKCKEATYCE